MTNPLFTGKPNENFDRPNGLEWATTSELKEQKFCGIRLCGLSNYREFWIDGECLLSMSEDTISMNPSLWDTKLSEVLGISIETLKGA